MRNKLLLIKFFVTLSVLTIATSPTYAQQDVKDSNNPNFLW